MPGAQLFDGGDVCRQSNIAKWESYQICNKELVGLQIESGKDISKNNVNDVMEGDSEKEGDPKVAYDTLDNVVNDKRNENRTM